MQKQQSADTNYQPIMSASLIITMCDVFWNNVRLKSSKWALKTSASKMQILHAKLYRRV